MDNLWTVSYVGKYTGEPYTRVYLDEDEAIDLVLDLDMSLYQHCRVQKWDIESYTFDNETKTYCWFALN